MNKVLTTLFFWTAFEFDIVENSETYYIGALKWDEKTKKKYLKICKINETEIDNWYLDKDWNRLEDEELFENTPWEIIENWKSIKVIQRFFNEKASQTQFAKKPWIRIGKI